MTDLSKLTIEERAKILDEAMKRMTLLEEEFGHFGNFLIYFNMDICDPETQPDKVVISNYVSENTNKIVQDAITDGKKLLKLPIEDFPANWMTSITLRCPLMFEGDKVHVLESTKENHYKWVKQVVEELEAEAKRQGKM